ncbi:MAG: hypothetical protein SFW67_36000 [Myxococcaceae bacterium]|nr:hypothetical protein [Myxococcaceae bacterium]
MVTPAMLLAVTAAGPMTHLRVDFEFTLVSAAGVAAPTTMRQTWFFEVPARRADDASMTELLHRIFWDQNVAMREKEPGDHAYLALVKFTSAPVDRAAVKASKGVGDQPWFEAQRKVVWEPSALFIVDAEGRYDNIGMHDFTELLLQRMYDDQQVTEAEFVAFFDTYTQGAIKGRVRFDARKERLALLTRIGPTVTGAPGSGSRRKKPGTKPFVSGPIDAPPPHKAR